MHWLAAWLSVVLTDALYVTPVVHAMQKAPELDFWYPAMQSQGQASLAELNSTGVSQYPNWGKRVQATQCPAEA